MFFQIVKSDMLEDQVEDSKKNYVQTFVKMSGRGVAVPQLVHDYLFDKHRSEFTNNHDADLSLSGNWVLFHKFVSDYIDDTDDRAKNHLDSLNSRGLFNVKVNSDLEKKHSFFVQYELNTVADFAMEEPEVSFLDGGYQCERRDRHKCATYAITDEIQQFISSKNALHAALIESLNLVTHICTDADEDGSWKPRDASSRSMTASNFLTLSLNMSSPAAPSVPNAKDSLDEIATVLKTKLHRHYPTCELFASHFMKPFDDYYSQTDPEHQDNFLSILGDHALISGSKCPKVVKRCFDFIGKSVSSKESAQHLVPKMDLLSRVLSSEPVNKIRFQPLIDVMLCVVSLWKPHKLFEVEDADTRALFVLDRMKHFPVEQALGLLNLCNRDERVLNPHLKRTLSFTLQKVSLYKKVLSLQVLSSFETLF